MTLDTDLTASSDNFLRNANIAGLGWGSTVAGYGLLTGTPILPGIGTIAGITIGFSV